MDDKKIIELIRSKQENKAFISLYNYFPIVRKMIISKGGREEDAQDIYQESLIVFYKKALNMNFELKSKIDTYLYSICKYMWNDQIKKKKRQNLLHFELDDDLNIESIEEHLKIEEQYIVAEDAISKLGERCRELLIKFYFQSIKLKKIAEQMGYSSENTVKNQKYKCLETAKKYLNQSNIN